MSKPRGEAVQDLPDGFKMTEFGVFPTNWQVVTLDDIALRISGGGTPSTKKPEYWDGPIPWTTSAVIDESDLYLERFQRTITKEGLEQSSAKIACKGSILVGTRVGVGKTVVTTFDVAINQDLTTIDPDTRVVLPEFLAFLFKTHRVQQWFESNKRGATIKGVPRKDLIGLQIPLPPLPEQSAIAHVLRTVQQAKETTEQVIAATRELKRSLMHHLFTYGPVPLDQAEQVPLKETEFGDVPEHWKVLRLEDCAFVQTGAAKGRRLGDSHTVAVPYLRVANVQDGYLDLSEIKHIQIRESEIERYRLQEGDVLLTEGGDFDKLGRGFIWQGQVSNCIHQNHIFAVRPDRSRLMPEYLAYLVQSNYGKAYFLRVAHRTTHLACINSTKLKAFPALLPDLGEQERIVSILESVDQKIEAKENHKAVLEGLFKTLLHHLMTGKVRVKELETEVKEV